METQMNDNEFVTTQQTTQDDYVLPQACYVPTEQVYTPLPKTDEEQEEMPEAVRNIYNSKIFFNYYISCIPIFI